MKQECKRFLIIYTKYFIVPTYHPTFQSASYALFGKPSVQTTYTRLQNNRYISHINTSLCTSVPHFLYSLSLIQSSATEKRTRMEPKPWFSTKNIQSCSQAICLLRRTYTPSLTQPTGARRFPSRLCFPASPENFGELPNKQQSATDSSCCIRQGLC